MTEDRTTTGPREQQDASSGREEGPSSATVAGRMQPGPGRESAPRGAGSPAGPQPGGAGDRPPRGLSGAHAAPPSAGAPTTVLPSAGSRPARPVPPRVDRGPGEPRSSRSQPPRAAGRRRARLVVQRVDAWSVFLFSLIASVCLGVVLIVAVAALYAALSSAGVLASLNGVLGEVAGDGTSGEVVEPFITAGRVLGATAVLAAIDVVLLTALATLGALLYNLCASLTGGIEVQLGERE